MADELHEVERVVDGHGGGREDLAADDHRAVDVVLLGRLRLFLDGFNLLNRFNYVSYVGIISSPVFGTPVSARSARQLQFSLGYKF